MALLPLTLTMSTQNNLEKETLKVCIYILLNLVGVLEINVVPKFHRNCWIFSYTISIVAPDVETMIPFKEEDAIEIEKRLEENSIDTDIKSDLPDVEEPEDENTKLGKELYTSAVKSLNSSTLRKADGWAKMKRAADLGNTDARIKVAFAQLLGNDYIPQNLESAKSTFEEATNEEGHPEAQFGLGFLYATGTMTNSSQATALLYYTFAAFGGNSWAQMALG